MYTKDPEMVPFLSPIPKMVCLFVDMAMILATCIMLFQKKIP